METDTIEDALAGSRWLIENEEDPKALAHMVMALTRLRGELAELLDTAHGRLALQLDGREQDLGTGIGMVRRTRDCKTTWDHEGLFKEVVNRHKTVDEDTGEVVIDGFGLAADIQAMVAFGYWRKTRLRDADIDFSEYVTDVYGKHRVRFLSKEGK